jgi:hypothetical protein
MVPSGEESLGTLIMHEYDAEILGDTVGQACLRMNHMEAMGSHSFRSDTMDCRRLGELTHFFNVGDSPRSSHVELVESTDSQDDVKSWRAEVDDDVSHVPTRLFRFCGTALAME